MRKLIDLEIENRLKKIEPSRVLYTNRINQLKLSSDEVITRIKQLNGFVIEITKKEAL